MLTLFARYKHFVVQADFPEDQPLDTDEHRAHLLLALGKLIVKSIAKEVRFYSQP